ncbi:MAG: DUF2461 domain-containing protein [Flavobacteriales bacterium]|nr:DUF2461 domain-containing protein [Flavobacteriales bacterium]
MKYFNQDYLQFFKDLAANNNRDWFQANKKRYESSVKKPFELFVADLISELKKHDKSINIKPSDAIFRINRDIRFSKDKTPYKLNASAVISRDGRKTDGASGVYVELGPEKLALAGGIYMPDKDKLQDIRDGITKNPKSFMKVLNDKTFVKVWGELQGEKNKILPAEHKKVAEVCPYIYNKQFYFWVELDPKIILTDKLMKTVVDHYLAGKPVGDFLNAQLK